MTTICNQKPRIAILISGNGSNLQALIDAVEAERFNGQIVCVVSNKSSAMGLQRAARAGIEHRCLPYGPHLAAEEPRQSYDAHLAAELSAFQPDLIVLAGFMRVLTPVFLAAFPDKVINLHPALPGAFPGLNAIERAWNAHLAGDLNVTGVMVHSVIPEVDAGPVLGTMELDMRAYTSLPALESAMHRAEHQLIVQVVGECCLALSA
jgi:phosphoribosylglycinamide formyltransferase 1